MNVYKWIAAAVFACSTFGGALGQSNPVTAVFTEVQVAPSQIEAAKVLIRKAVPGSHVRRIISGGDVDATLMVMVHPQGNFREFINDYYRALDNIPGLVSSRTHLGTTDKVPQFSNDEMLAWRFIKLTKSPAKAQFAGVVATLKGRPQVVEVAHVNGKFDVIVVYKWNGSTLDNFDNARASLDEGMPSGVEIFIDRPCP